MAAYYHILTPFEISIEDNPALEKQFLAIYGHDFILSSTHRIEQFSPKLPNGERLDFSYNEKTYVLPDKIVRKEFSSFCQVFFEEWRNLYESKFKGKFYATQMSVEEMASQISQANSLIKKYPLVSNKLEDKLRDLDDNYFFSIEGIMPQVVYQGYPLNTDRHTSLNALDFLHSYEKMGVYPDEYVAMYLLDKMKEKYGEQFILAKYLFIAGY
jgi:hypothetical protein